MLRFVDDVFVKPSTATIGVDLKITIIIVDGFKVKLQIWDTAGQERFWKFNKAYYKGAQGVVFVYEMTDRHSFEILSEFLSDSRQYAPKDVCKVVVACKCDRAEEREVSYEEGEEFAKEAGASFFETSAKTGEGVDVLFIELTGQMIKQYYNTRFPDKDEDKSEDSLTITPWVM